MKKVFIDGSAGTTGLRIRSRLEGRCDIELCVLSEELRKDVGARRAALNAADIVFLCLPDDAAREAVGMIENPATVVIDTSTAHRTREGWEYGFPELEGRRERIAAAKRIANPGCHASGMIALIEPLVRKGLIKKSAALSVFSLTGYSGGGKKMIADYESAATPLHQGGGLYGLNQGHKHLPEMVKVCGLEGAPVFCPIIVPSYSGMETMIPLFGVDVAGTMEDVKKVYQEYYCGPGVVKYVEDPAAAEGGKLSSAALSTRDDMEVTVTGTEERMVLVARFDNLGKGASGAAIQNMNIVLGVDERTGLITKEN